MKTRILILAAIAAVFCSCRNENLSELIQNKDTKLTINPVIDKETRAGFTPQATWSEGNRLGVFVWKSTGWGQQYTDGIYTDLVITQNNEYTRVGSSWRATNDFYLLSEKAHVYAYYPYSSSVSDGTKIPVSITSSDGTAADYMYGITTTPVSVSNTEANIVMKHALCQLAIKLNYSPDYNNKGHLQQMKLTAKNNKFSLTGTMDLSGEGKITPTNPGTTITWTPDIYKPGSGDEYFNAAFFPMSFSDQEVVMTLTIDGANYTYNVPAITYEHGKRYIYSLVLKSNSAEIGGEAGNNITIEEWSDSSQDNINLVPVQ